MIEDVYQQALQRIKQRLNDAGAHFVDEEGELLVGDHRVDLAIAFDGFVQQGSQMLAPLDIRMHVDHGDEDRFRVGTLGIGPTPAAAIAAALDEWLTLAAAPVLQALSEPSAKLRVQTAHTVWHVFPGNTSLRGTPPPKLKSAGGLLEKLVRVIHMTIRGWSTPRDEQLRSLAVVVSQGDEGFELQAAIDGAMSELLIANLAALEWPKTIEPYVLKQLFVVRGEPA